MSVRRYWELTPGKDTAWLHRAYRAVLKEYEFWTNTDGNTIEDHSTPVKGLQRYGHHSDTAALATFYDRVLKGRFRLDPGAPRETKIRMAAHRMAAIAAGDEVRIGAFTVRAYPARHCRFDAGRPEQLPLRLRKRPRLL